MDEAAKPKTRKVFVGVLLVIASLGIFVAALYLTGGLDLVMALVTGQKPATVGESPVPPKPAKPAPTAPSSVGNDTEDTSPTVPAGASGSGSSGTVVPAGALNLSDEIAWMYWEQVDSQETIGELVAGKWDSYSITSVDKTSSEASLHITGKYESGSSLRGTMVVHLLDGKWYFTKITRDGNTSPGPDGRRGTDKNVIKTLVTEQSLPENQECIAGLLDGGYKKITINSVKKGSGTATIDITLSRGTKGNKAGRIVCITKNVSGRKLWFITKIEER